MAQACPLNFVRVDNTTARIVSLLAAGFLTAYLLGGSPLWLLFLGADLTVRLYGRSAYSPLHRSAKWLQHRFELRSRPADGAAKNVAGHFGLFFLLTLTALHWLQATAALYTVAAVYGVCLLMDALWGFCVGCRVYHWYRAVFPEGGN